MIGGLSAPIRAVWPPLQRAARVYDCGISAAVKPLVPSWDLPLVLRALSSGPFEPLDSVDLKFLSMKTAFLLAMTSAKRVRELGALSVHPECMQFAPGGHVVRLRPNPAFVPKVLGSVATVELMAFHPPPFTCPDDQRLNLLCPVRALRTCVDRAKAC